MVLCKPVGLKVYYNMSFWIGAKTLNVQTKPKVFSDGAKKIFGLDELPFLGQKSELAIL